MLDSFKYYYREGGLFFYIIQVLLSVICSLINVVLSGEYHRRRDGEMVMCTASHKLLSSTPQPLNNRLSHVEDYCDNEEVRELRPVMTQPDWTIKGGPAIKTYAVLNDKRHVLTRDTEENVALWDILKVIIIVLVLGHGGVLKEDWTSLWMRMIGGNR